MANVDQNRVTKDTSARKPSATRSAVVSAARKKLQDLYVEEIISGYEEQLVSLREGHGQEIADLKAQLSGNETIVLQKQNEAVEKAKAEACHEGNAQVVQHQKKIQELTSKNKELRSTFDEEFAKKKSEISDVQQKLMRAQTGAVARQKAHDEVVSELRRQLTVGPNTWIEINLRRKGGKTRTYVRRPSASFQVAMEELCRETGLPFCSLMFEHNGQEIMTRGKTFNELGIKDKDDIWFSRS